METYYPLIEQSHTPAIEIDHGEPVPNPDVPGRTRAILQVVERLEVGPVVPVRPPERTEFIEAVHAAEYLSFLRSFWPAWSARYPDRQEAIPHTIALRDGVRSLPPALEHQIGWWVFDTGNTLNVPLPPSIDDRGYLAALQPVLDEISRIDPVFLVASLGFDIYIGDPLGDFALTQQGLYEIGRHLKLLNLPSLVVQEGGYAVEALDGLADAFFRGLLF